jgi:hypothetical protein
MIGENLRCLERSRSFGADQNEVHVSRQLVQAGRQRAERNVVSARDLPFGYFVRLANVEEIERWTLELIDELHATDRGVSL